MRPVLRELFTRWGPIVEYMLAGDVRMMCAVMALLLMGWYAFSDCLWQFLADTKHEELDYGFLLFPLPVVYWRAWRIRREIDETRDAQIPLPLPPLSLPKKMIAAMLRRTPGTGKLARRFLLWRARMIGKGGKPAYRMEEVARAWRARPAFWLNLAVRTAAPLLLAVFLASPSQYYLGDLLARGLDYLMPPEFVGGQICPADLNMACTDMTKEKWPGDLVALTADAPSSGTIRLRVRNWPRSGRYAHFKSAGLHPLDPRYSTAEASVPVRCCTIDIGYIVNDTNSWALWAEVEYFSFRGERFQTAAYSGKRVPDDVPPNYYH